jgi:hypothetical protein
VSLASGTCEAYSAVSGQCEHIRVVVLCSDFIVCKIYVYCVAYNLLIFSMKQNHCTVEFKKKKRQVLLCSGIRGLMTVILGGGRSTRNSCARHGG